MSKELRRAAAGITAAAACLVLSLPAAAQSPAPPSLQEQLQAQYQLSKISTAGGCTLTTPGTALRFQKPGVFAVPASSLVFCPVKFEDGKLNGPNAFCKMTVKQNAGSFQAGDRVYVTNIDANPQKDKVAFKVSSCEQGASWKGEVVFQFAKGYLSNASVTEVEDKIGELLALDDAGGNGQQARNSNPPPDQGQPPPQAGGDQGQAQGQPQQPATIRLGQTQQEVEAAMGQPDAKADLGSKQIYSYKSLGLKVTFQDGRVAKVE